MVERILMMSGRKAAGKQFYEFETGCGDEKVESINPFGAVKRTGNCPKNRN